MVVLRDRVPGLAGLVRRVIVVEGPVSGLDQVVRALLSAAHMEEDQDALVEAILAREQDLPTAMGMGVVLPHTYVEGAEEAQCMIALVPAGVPGETPDGVPIQLVCLMLSPADHPERHLQAMASMARLLHDRAYVERLVAQSTAEGVRRRIHDRE